MAMNVRDKINLCSTKSLSGFFVSSVDTTHFYKRRPEFENLIHKYARGTEFEGSFAMPYYNKETHGIEWFIDPVEGQPVPLSSLAGTPEYELYRAQREKTVQFFRDKAAKMHPSERAYVDSMLKYVDVDYMDDVTFCYQGRVIIGVWGMTPRAEYTPSSQITTNVKANELKDITFSLEGHGELVSQRPLIKCRAGYRLTAANGDIPQVVAGAGSKFVGWKPFDPNGYVVEDSMHFTAVCEREELPPEPPQPGDETVVGPDIPAPPAPCRVQFNPDQFGTIPPGTESLEVPMGTCLNAMQVPTPQPMMGYRFAGWNMDPYLPINNDVMFTAIYERDMKQVHFNVGTAGQIMPGLDLVEVPAGSPLDPQLVPAVTPLNGWVFKGWDRDLSLPVMENMEVNAVYEKKKGNGCLKALLIALLVILGILLVLLLVKFITGVPDSILADAGIPGHYADVPGYADGGRIDDIFSTPINGGDLGDGILPGNGDNDYHSGMLPTDPGDFVDGRDGGPQIVDGVVNLFFEDDNADLNSFARDFRGLYADTQKYLLDYDDYVKRVSIKFPPSEREAFESKVKNELGGKYAFIMVDEYVLQSEDNTVTTLQTQPRDRDWYVDAVHAKQAWTVTRGSQDVVVAVVDDGCDVNHTAFTGRIVKPYNVWTKSSTVGAGGGHGTHVAGLAVGTTTSSGVSGIAPQCKLMPVQVFPNDADYSTLSAEVSGIAYAIHQGAQVINVSMGSDFSQFRSMSVAEQEQMSETTFKELEKMWDRVYRMAQKKNVVIVFAAGNDNVLSCLEANNRPPLSITVTAYTEDMRKADFSNFGKGSTVAAPGEGIVSSIPGNRYTAYDGTSMAAPIVTGVVALMKSVNDDISISQTKRILMETGKRNNQHIGPMVLADKAVERARDAS